MVKQVSIGEVFEFVRNGASIKQEDNKSGYPITRIETIWNETIDDSRFGYADVFDKDLVKYEKYLLEIGDILMTHINSPKHLGKSAMYNGIPEKLIHGMNLLCLRPDKKISDSKYLKHYLNSSYFKELLPKISNQSVNQASFSAGNLKSLEIPLPPLQQQQKIANILDAADALRQNDKALIAKFDELTQALFLDMFGDPVSNPKGFELSTVGIQCNVKGGKRIPKEEKLVAENTGFPYIKAGNIKSGKVTLKDLEYLLPQTREKLKRYIVEKGDVCITVVGANIGDIGIVPDELHLANLTENANKILIKDKIILNNYYLAKYLQMDFVQKNINAKTMAVGVPKLALFRIEQIELLIPPIALQRQYEERVALIEEQKGIAQKSLEQSERLFNSLLQKAFKGAL